MKWLAIFLGALLVILVWSEADAKAPQNVELEENQVLPVKTALGFTTILQFNTRPTSVILGDQDAFKVEYVGSGIAIKPVMSKAQSNLFVFTNYDRFSFRLSVDNSQNSDFILKIKRKTNSSYNEAPNLKEDNAGSEKLFNLKLNNVSLCDGKFLEVNKLSWPANQKIYLIHFRLGFTNQTKVKNIKFEPGDLELFQNEGIIPIETLNLSALEFSSSNPFVTGMIIIKQNFLKRGLPLELRFTATEFLKDKKPCLRVRFSRGGGKNHVQESAKKETQPR
jgi:hypothetical protein